jgi:CsoR family transcriptional regulator, copper-sensing transcriptional repressor
MTLDIPRARHHLPGEPPGDATTGTWSKRSLIRRFRRIEGQARGLQKMLEEDRDADDLLMQIASMREALHGAASLVLESYLVRSAEEVLVAEDAEQAGRLLARTIELFRKWAS